MKLGSAIQVFTLKQKVAHLGPSNVSPCPQNTAPDESSGSRNIWVEIIMSLKKNLHTGCLFRKKTPCTYIQTHISYSPTFCLSFAFVFSRIMLICLLKKCPSFFLLLLIPLSRNLLYFPLCSIGGLLDTRLPSG